MLLYGNERQETVLHPPSPNLIRQPAFPALTSCLMDMSDSLIVVGVVRPAVVVFATDVQLVDGLALGVGSRLRVQLGVPWVTVV